MRFAMLCPALAAAQTDPFIRSFDAIATKATPALSSGIILDGARLTEVYSWRAALMVDTNAGVLGLSLGEQKLGDLIPFRADAHALFAFQVGRQQLKNRRTGRPTKAADLAVSEMNSAR